VAAAAAGGAGEGKDTAALIEELRAYKEENARMRAALGMPPPPPPAAAAPKPAPAAAAAAAPAAPAKKAPPAHARKAAAPKLKAAGKIEWPAAGEQFWLRAPRALPADTTPSGRTPPPLDAAPLHVCHISAEMAPFAKVGGLADVVTGLSRECLARGHNVEVLLPFYEALDAGAHCEGLTPELEYDVPTGRMQDGQLAAGVTRTAVFRATIAGVPVALLRPVGSPGTFRAPYGAQGGAPELQAYLYFCRAALEYLRVTDRQPDVLHVHEWQASAAAMLYWDVYHAQGLWKPSVLLTIHNMDSTGECKADEFATTGVDGAAFMARERALDERTIGHNPERMCLLKGGIVYANAVTTVSRTYRDETLRGGSGWLGATLAQYASKYTGVVNGIDDGAWDPTADPFIPALYSATDLAGKAACKKFLQMGLGLEVNPSKPLIIAVSRLVAQKGIGAMLHAAARAEALGAQFVLLGTGGADGPFRALAEGSAKESSSVRIMLMYNDALAHCLFAAGDITIVPSAFEPCGLTQMVGQRYGSVPVVRRTGGLADTVADVGGAPPGEGTGFSYDGDANDTGAFEGALARAVAMCATQPEAWAALVGTCMTRDVSWATPTEEYLQLYREIKRKD
jgi:starch synthase